MMRSRPPTKRGAIAYGRAECCGFPKLKPQARENVSTHLVRFPFVMFKSSFASCAKLWEVTYAAALSKKCLSFMLGRQWVCTWCEACKVWVFAVEAFLCVGIYNCACFACDMSTWEIFTFEMLILLWNVYLWNAYFCEMFTCEMLTFVKCLLAYTCEMLLLWNVYLCTCEISTCDTLTFINAYLCTCELLTCEMFTCEMLTCVYLWNAYLWNVYLCESFDMV